MHCMNIPYCSIKAEIAKLNADERELNKRIKHIKEMRKVIAYIKGRRLVTFRPDAFNIIRQGILRHIAERPIPRSKKNSF